MKTGRIAVGMLFRLVVFCGLLFGSMLQVGCATQAMKGTPFYTGEWTQREGKVEDRVALWPFLYYRDPALSVLWPLIEKSPDHFALRPLYTVRGLDHDHLVHHVLWPFGKFDFTKKEYRFFPVFLGKHYFGIFPLYWHFDDPFLGKDGTNSLFPLWVYDKSDLGKDRSRHILHLAWPLARFEYGPRVTSNRIFPLFGSRKEAGQWRYVVSLPYGWVRDEKDGQSAGWLLPFYAYRKGGADTFLLTPVFQQGRHAANGYDWHMIAPLYYRWISDHYAGFYSLLGGWSYKEDGSRKIVGPLYMGSKDAQGYGLDLIPLLLSWRTKQPERTNWYILGPLSRLSFGENPAASYVFPIGYKNPKTRTVLTPVFQKGGNKNSNTHWHSMIPLYLRRKSPDMSAWVTPLGAVTRSADGGHRTITPLYVNLTEGDGKSFHAVPPLLSWQLREDEARDNWIALGLARFGFGGEASPSHLIPIYYRNPEKETTVTPVWASWKEGRKKWKAVPPLLSWQHEDASSNRSTRVLGGLYGQTRETGGELEKSHLVPIYTYEKGKHLYTPVMGRDAPDDGTFRYWFTPLIGSYRNRFAGSWFWPLYRYRRNTKTDYRKTSFLLWGYHRAGENFSKSGFFPMFSRSKQVREPLEPVDKAAPENNQYRHRTIYQNSLSLMLLYRRGQVVTQYGPRTGPVVAGTRYFQREELTNRLFPLWYYRQEAFGKKDGTVQTEGSLLWKLYDYQREEGTNDQPHEYVRHRVLWRVWHYESLNGQVSVDSIPFVTYDSKPNGFRKLTFLWRFFRYETDPEAGKKLDLCFIPIMRTKPK